MQCNIDAKGKAARLTSGIITIVVGLVLLGLMRAGIMPAWGWILTGCVLFAGAFQIFEARAGWCVLRAMGIKTPV